MPDGPRMSIVWVLGGLLPLGLTPIVKSRPEAAEAVPPAGCSLYGVDKIFNLDIMTLDSKV